jgi:hypothetical protein
LKGIDITAGEQEFKFEKKRVAGVGGLGFFYMEPLQPELN